MSDEERTRFVVGLDLSLTGTGLADLDIEDHTFVNVDTYGTKGKRKDTYKMRANRLRKTVDFIFSWITAGPQDPELVVMEGPSFGSTNGSQHDRSGLWWLVYDELTAAGIPVLVVSPKTRAKYATGNGNSGKDVVVAHVNERYGDMVEDGVGIDNDNEADAIVLAAIGARYLDWPVEEYGTLPLDNIKAMDGIEAV